MRPARLQLVDLQAAACWTTLQERFTDWVLLDQIWRQCSVGKVADASRSASASMRSSVAELGLILTRGGPAYVHFAECGTHAIIGAEIGPCTSGETTLARPLLRLLEEGMLLLVDRGFPGYERWQDE